MGVIAKQLFNLRHIMYLVTPLVEVSCLQKAGGLAPVAQWETGPSEHESEIHEEVSLVPIIKDQVKLPLYDLHDDPVNRFFKDAQYEGMKEELGGWEVRFNFPKRDLVASNLLRSDNDFTLYVQCGEGVQKYQGKLEEVDWVRLTPDLSMEADYIALSSMTFFVEQSDLEKALVLSSQALKAYIQQGHIQFSLTPF